MIGPPVVDGAWQRPGCGDRCIRLAAPMMGSGATEIVEAHDPDAHEEYARRLLVPEVIRTGPLLVDIPRIRVVVAGAEVSVSGGRWRLLRCLAERLDLVVPQGALLSSIDPSLIGACCDHYLTSTMNQLRGRLGDAGRLIENRPGLGYVLRADPPMALEHAS